MGQDGVKLAKQKQSKNDTKKSDDKSETIKNQSLGKTYLRSVEYEGVKSNLECNYIDIHLPFMASSRRLLMLSIVDSATKKVTIKSVKDIYNAYPGVHTLVNSKINKYKFEKESERNCIQTEGVNFEAIWSLSYDIIDFQNIYCNHIYLMLITYGVEAARFGIVQEIKSVFNVYGIDVNYRHLNLIGDFMTRTGSYIAMNRIGMNHSASPFLQMSFETTCQFLTKAAQEGGIDYMESPSARIVMGSVPHVGTGCCDVLIPLNTS